MDPDTLAALRRYIHAVSRKNPDTNEFDFEWRDVIEANEKASEMKQKPSPKTKAK